MSVLIIKGAVQMPSSSRKYTRLARFLIRASVAKFKADFSWRFEDFSMTIHTWTIDIQDRNWTLTRPLQWLGRGEPSSVKFFQMRFLWTPVWWVTHLDFNCGNLLSWQLASLRVNWWVSLLDTPLWANSTLTYALVTAAQILFDSSYQS